MLLKNLIQSVAHALAVDMSSYSTCTNKWCPKASKLCPFSLPYKTAQMVSPSYAQKQSSNGDNFLVIGGHFECNN